METKKPEATTREQPLKGQRVTAQRKLLLDLVSRAEGHVDADELYRRAKEREPRVSLSTVYRTLRLFKKLGLIEERHFDEEHHHYEAKGAKEHYHLLCLRCGKITELSSHLPQQMIEEVAREKGFQVVGAEIELTGYCATCQKKGRRRPENREVRDSGSTPQMR